MLFLTAETLRISIIQAMFCNAVGLAFIEAYMNVVAPYYMSVNEK